MLVERALFQSLLTYVLGPPRPMSSPLSDSKHSSSATTAPLSQRPRRTRNRGPRQRYWVFTSYLDVMPIVYDPDVVRYIIYQREICPDTKREHFQGYVEFYDPLRKGQIKKVLGQCHLEVLKTTRSQARNYCKKKKSAIPHTLVEFGTWREDPNRKPKLRDILLTDMSLHDVIVKYPFDFVRYHHGLKALFNYRQSQEAKKFRHVTTTVYIGPTGCGKTRRALAGDDWFKMPISDKLWFDGYTGQKTLVLDDFYGGIKYSNLLQILHGHMISVQVKGGFVFGMWTHVIITSNKEPQDWYKMGLTPALERRLTNIIHLPDVFMQ